MKNIFLIIFFFQLNLYLILCFQYHKIGNVLLMDHLNINHEIYRHDLVKEFYFNTLGLAIDPRKNDNLLKERKTLWANAGITQLHLPEAPAAQVLDGIITIAYDNKKAIENLIKRLNIALTNELLKETKFQWKQFNDEIIINDPWGNQFKIIFHKDAIDKRGVQPGPLSAAANIIDLQLNVPSSTNLPGIARFYEHVFHAPCYFLNDEKVSIITSPLQTLTFQISSSSTTTTIIKEDEIEYDKTGRKILKHYGPHISFYLKDMISSYKKAEELNILFINERFQRRAYCLNDAIEQCMFRCFHIIDPLYPNNGIIFNLEHEIRSIRTKDGKKYKSCPFYDIEKTTF